MTHEVDETIPDGAAIDLDLDVAFKWDTTAIVPLWQAPDYRLLDPDDDSGAAGDNSSGTPGRDQGRDPRARRDVPD